MWPRAWVKGRVEVLRELDDWRGSTAQAWEYSVSHAQFLVRMFREEELKGRPLVSFYLWMKSCDRVSFSGIWRGANIQIEEKPGKYGPELLVSDGDHLLVQCGAVFAASSAEMIRIDDQRR